MRAFGRDLIRGGHYGQRSCEPHLKAEHMAAPTNAAYVKKALANSEPSTHGTFETSTGVQLHGRFQGVIRTLGRRRSRAEFDPKRTSAASRVVAMLDHRCAQQATGAPLRIRCVRCGLLARRRVFTTSAVGADNSSGCPAADRSTGGRARAYCRNPSHPRNRRGYRASARG